MNVFLRRRLHTIHFCLIKTEELSWMDTVKACKAIIAIITINGLINEINEINEIKELKKQELKT